MFDWLQANHSPTFCLSKNALTLDEIDQMYGKIDRWSLVDLTRRLPEWRNPRGSCFPIDPADILRASGRSEEEIWRIAQNAERALLLQDLDQIQIESE